MIYTKRQHATLNFLNRHFDLKPNSSNKEEFTFCCPECPEGDDKFHCGINITKEIGGCFKCGYSFTLSRLIKDVATPAVVAQVYREIFFDGFTGVSSIAVTEEAGKQDIENGSLKFSDIIRELGAESLRGNVLYKDMAMRYLVNRGIPEQEIYNRNFLICNKGKYSGRVIIPIYFEGKPVSFVARDFTGTSKLKELSPDSSMLPEPSKFLYNWDTASLYETLFLVEGVFDAYAIMPSGVATFGKRLRPEQELLIIKRKPKAVYVARDPDALRESLESLERLSTFIPTFIMLIDKDPDELTKEEWSHAISNARSAGSPEVAQLRLRTTVAKRKRRKKWVQEGYRN